MLRVITNINTPRRDMNIHIRFHGNLSVVCQNILLLTKVLDKQGESEGERWSDHVNFTGIKTNLIS